MYVQPSGSRQASFTLPERTHNRRAIGWSESRDERYQESPTLFEWIGGMPGVQKLFEGPAQRSVKMHPCPVGGLGRSERALQRRVVIVDDESILADEEKPISASNHDSENPQPCLRGSKTTPSSPTTRASRWWPRTARSTGSASPGSIPTPASPPCSARPTTDAGRSRRKGTCAQYAGGIGPAR